MSKIKRCPACKRTLQAAINEHKKSGVGCNQEGCVFTNEINSALGIKKIIRINPANKQNTDKKIIKIKPQTRQSTPSTAENIEIDFTGNGELRNMPNINVVLEWLKGRIEYSRNDCDFEYELIGNNCRCKYVLRNCYNSYYHRYNRSNPCQEYIFNISDLIEVINPQNDYLNQYGSKVEGKIELVAFGGKKILHRDFSERNDSSNAIEWLSNIVGNKKPKYQKVSSFYLCFANNSSHPYAEIVNTLNYVIRFFGGGRNIR